MATQYNPSRKPRNQPRGFTRGGPNPQYGPKMFNPGVPAPGSIRRDDPLQPIPVGPGLTTPRGPGMGAYTPPPVLAPPQYGPQYGPKMFRPGIMPPGAQYRGGLRPVDPGMTTPRYNPGDNMWGPTGGLHPVAEAALRAAMLRFGGNPSFNLSDLNY